MPAASDGSGEARHRKPASAAVPRRCLLPEAAGLPSALTARVAGSTWAALALLAGCHRPAAPAPTRPRFERTLLLETSSETSANVSIGDLDGNGSPDLVLAKGRHWPLVDRVLLNDGHGRFPDAHDLGTASDRSYSAPLADLDGDGSLDIVISNDRPDPKLVYLNDGTGHFRVGSRFGQPDWPTRNAAVADLDGDHRPDIVVANRNADASGVGSNYVCLNRGGGMFDADCLAFSRESSTTITPIDIDGDGRVDVVVPHRDGGQSYVYLNDGTAHFPRRFPFGPPDASIRAAQVADLDGDGRLDLVAIDEPPRNADLRGHARRAVRARHRAGARLADAVCAGSR